MEFKNQHQMINWLPPLSLVMTMTSRCGAYSIVREDEDEENGEINEIENI